jgi:hypothetical protein
MMTVGMTPRTQPLHFERLRVIGVVTVQFAGLSAHLTAVGPDQQAVGNGLRYRPMAVSR